MDRGLTRRSIVDLRLGPRGPIGIGVSESASDALDLAVESGPRIELEGRASACSLSGVGPSRRGSPRPQGALRRRSRLSRT